MLGSIRREEISAKKLVRSLLESYWTSEIMEEFGSSKFCKPVFVQGIYWFTIFIKAPPGKDKGWKVTDTIVSGEDILDVARQIWMTDVETGDVVTVYLELEEGGLIQERPFEVPRESVLLNVNCTGNDIAEKAFLEMIWMVKKLSYGMDIETLEPKKVLENPFFGLKSPEEIAVKLDLLSGNESKMQKEV